MVLPAVAVDGTGAEALPVPPVAVVYQSNPVPVAVNAVAVIFWQKVTGEFAKGAGVPDNTLTTIGTLILSPQDSV